MKHEIKFRKEEPRSLGDILLGLFPAHKAVEFFDDTIKEMAREKQEGKKDAD